VVAGSEFVNLQALLTNEQTEHALLNLLKRLAVSAIPLYLRLALNFINVELEKTPDILALAALPEIETLFAMPEIGSDWEDVTAIDHATCKLALVSRVFVHNPEWKAVAWKMALPHRLDKDVLQVLFGDEAQVMCNSFVKTGLMPSLRWEEGKRVSLRKEIRDLLLAYAKYKNWLETEETKVLHQQLADSFAQRYQKNADIRLLLNKLYHQLIADFNADLNHIKQPKPLNEMMALLLEEGQYKKISQVILRLIEIQPNFKNAYRFLGACLEGQGNLSEAIVMYKKHLKIEPNDEITWIRLGKVFSEQDKLVEAIAVYKKLLKINPKHESVWYLLANALSNIRKFDEAESAYRKQLEINPNHKSAQDELDKVGCCQAQYEAGLDVYQENQRQSEEEQAIYQEIRAEEEAAYRKQSGIPNHKDAWYNSGDTSSR